MSNVETKTLCQCPGCQAEREITPLYAERGISGLCLFLNTSIQEAPPEVTYARIREATHMLIRSKKLEEVRRLCREVLEFAATLGRDQGVQVMINHSHQEVTRNIMESAVRVSREIGEAMGSNMVVLSNHDLEEEGKEEQTPASPDSFHVDTPTVSGKPVVH